MGSGRRQSNRLLVLAAALSLMLSLTACWDRLDIDRRAFIVGIALDRASKPPEAGSGAEAALNQEGRWLSVSYQIANPAAFAGGEGGGGGEAEPFSNISTTSPSLFAAGREIATRLDLIPDFEHVQLVVISEEVAREGLEPMLDYFQRNARISRRAQVVIAKGEAMKVLAVKSTHQPLSSFYVADIVRQSDTRTGHFSPSIDMTALFQGLESGASMVIPRVIPQEKEVKVAGGAVIRDHHLAGWLGEAEAEGLRWLTGQEIAGAITVRPPGVSGVDTFEVFRGKTDIRPELSNGSVSFRVVINVTGDLTEHQGTQPAATKEHVQRFAGEVARTIQTEVLATVDKLKEFEADAVGFGRELEKKSPSAWKQLKERWEQEVFPTVPVTVEARVRINQLGLRR